MEISFHKHFYKEFANLSPKMHEKIEKTIDIFQENPHDQQLNNHASHGKEKHKRSISASGDLRLIFKEKNNYQEVFFVRVGTHNQVY